MYKYHPGYNLQSKKISFFKVAIKEIFVWIWCSIIIYKIKEIRKYSQGYSPFKSI